MAELADLEKAVLDKTLAGKFPWRRKWFESGYKAKVDGFKFDLYKSMSGQWNCSVEQSHGRARIYFSRLTGYKLWECLRGLKPVRSIEDAVNAVNNL